MEQIENQGKQRTGKLMMEALWWIITVIVAWIVAEPLWADFVRQSFIYELIMYIIIFITASRYIFLLKYTFLSHFQVLKVILIFSCLPLVFYLIQVFFNYRDFLEKQHSGMIEFQTYFRDGLTFDEHFTLITYLSGVFSFFGMSAIIAIIIFPFRMLLSFWRVHNNTGMV